MLLLASAFSSVLLHVICGQPTGREFANQLAKKPTMVVAADVKKIQKTKKTRGSDMVAKGMMKVHATHGASKLVMETSKALD